MPPDLALSSTLTGSNYPCLELIVMVPKVFEPLKFDYIVQYFEYFEVHVRVGTKGVGDEHLMIKFRYMYSVISVFS